MMKKELFTPEDPVVTNAELINFYMDKAAHYPISDLFMMNYRQKDNNYIELYKTFTFAEHNGKPEDKAFYTMVDSLWKPTEKETSPGGESNSTEPKQLKWLTVLPKEFVLCQENRSYSGLEPNQKWHFLVSWAAFSLVADKINETINKKTVTQKYPKINAFERFHGLARLVKCPELLLWMLEAAVDGKNLTAADVSAYYADAVTYRIYGTTIHRTNDYMTKLEKAILTAPGKTPVLL